MNYEEKYKDAQKWIEGIYADLSHEHQMEAEGFFPELADSNDDRIRKELIEFLQLPHSIFVGELGKREQENYIAWLEKKGEQKPTDKAEPK